jgi:hypothetical protein
LGVFIDLLRVVLAGAAEVTCSQPRYNVRVTSAELYYTYRYPNGAPDTRSLIPPSGVIDKPR